MDELIKEIAIRMLEGIKMSSASEKRYQLVIEYNGFMQAVAMSQENFKNKEI